MLKAENLLNKSVINQTDGVYYGLVDGFAANYSEEQLDIIYRWFLNAGSSLPKEYVTNETLSTITCSNVSTLKYTDFSNIYDITDITQSSDWLKTKSITSYIKPTAIQYWDQVCNVETIITADLVITLFQGMTSLILKENVDAYPENYRGGYIITRLDTNKSMLLYQSSDLGNGYNFFESDDSQSTLENSRLLTTKDIGKTIPFKIEWSPIIP